MILARPALPSSLTRTCFRAQSRSLATAAASATTSKPSFFQNQPLTPTLVTSQIPGPKSQSLSKEIGEFQENRAHAFVVDYANSNGTWIKDADGNVLLDLFSQIASIAIGYNNPSLRALAQTPEFITAVLNRPALGSFPPIEFTSWIEEGLGKARPKGMEDSQIFTVMCGSCANETAYKAAFMSYRARERGVTGQTEFTNEELSSCMKNQSPGSPDLSILSFNSGFHGRLFGSLTSTHSKAIHKIDIPSFNWPSVDWPRVKYPLNKNAEFNKEAEKKSLESVREAIFQSRKPGASPIAAVVVEPIQSEGGDNHASVDFFRSLRKITKEEGVYLIVDEVQTGVGATGRMWAHEKWNLETPPDFVTFSKKMQAAGFYHFKETRPSLPYRNYNTWLGDPLRILQAREIIDFISKNDLLDHTSKLGSNLYSSLTSIFSHFPGQVSSLRGENEGTFIAFDLPTSSKRDEFVFKMRSKGIHLGGCGERAVRLRPMLILEQSHVDLFLEKLEEVLREMK